MKSENHDSKKSYLHFFTNRFSLLTLLVCYLIFINKLYYDRIGSFSFGDEYNNFIAGYFMVKGRILFSQIFFNHQMLMAYVSFAIQKILHPSTLYKLVLYHRLFIIFFSSIFDILLVFRFTYKALGFVILYETLKYYLFGNLFLAEAVIVYPFIYLFFLLFEKVDKRYISSLDIILSGIFVWFIIFMREPFIPLAIYFYGFILFEKKIKKIHFISLSIFAFLSVITLISVSFKDYFYQVIVFNLSYKIPGQTQASDLIQILFYPLALFIGGKWNFFRASIIECSIIFLILFCFNLMVVKSFKKVSYIFLSLALAGFRVVIPGMIFFEAFHMLVWYALFFAAIFVMMPDVFQTNYKKIFNSMSLAIFLLIISLFLPQSFIWEKINRDDVFTINYARHYINGEVIRILSQPKDTMFADTWDYLVYWQAGIDSSYPYAVYTFTTAGDTKFQKIKKRMLDSNPPQFYYTTSPSGTCIQPQSGIAEYVRVYSKDKSTCLYIIHSKILEISHEQWQSASKLGFTL